MIEQAIHCLARALHHREDAVRQPRLAPQIGEEQRRRRVLLARLEDERVPARDRVREHPHRHHGREVEGRDAGHHAERLPDRVHVDAARRLLRESTLEQVGHAARELDILDASCNLSLRIGQHLAVLRRDDRREVITVTVEQVAEAEQHGGPLRERCRPPLTERSGGGFDRSVDLRCGGEVHLARLLAGGRVEDGALLAGGARDHLATDPVADPLQAAIVAFCMGQRVRICVWCASTG